MDVRRRIATVVLAVAVTGAGCTAARPRRSGEAPAPTATIVRVVDGDTVVMEIGDREERVRLIGMDTPERSDPLGPRATGFLRSLLPAGATVSYVTDVDARDRYGRLLAYLWSGGGASRDPLEMVNAQIVAAGWARTLTIPPNVQYADLFLRLQRQARAAKRGMWATEPFPVPT